MKAIWTSRSYGHDNYIGGFPAGIATDRIVFEAFDKELNQFEIAYTGKQNMPANLHDYDIDVEVKFTLTPKKSQEIVKEFK